MSKRMWSAALALSLGGGVYLAASTAQASNMGFKLEREFNYKTTSAAGNRPLLNVYYLSIPLFNGLGDIADTTAINPVGGQPFKNKCVGENGGPPGPAGDGEINVDDMLCDLWTARVDPTRAGTFQIISIDSANCAVFSRTGNIQIGVPNFSGVPFPPAGTDLWTNRGYQINVAISNAVAPPVNRAVIVGSHDPSFAGQVIHFSTTCGPTALRSDLLTIPYHTMFQKSPELLCGLRGVAWQDTDNNWRPDDNSPAGCAGGVFDGATTITVLTAVNDDPALGGRSGFFGQTARIGGLPPAVQLAPVDPVFDIIPGEAYRVNMLPGQQDRALVNPHF
jgi:hypothetical protein